METTIPLPLIPSLDLASKPYFETGLPRAQFKHLGLIFFVAKPETFDLVFDFLKGHTAVRSYVNAAALEESDILSLLDAGARCVFVKEEQVASLEKYGDRIGLAATSAVSKVPAGGALIDLGDAALVKSFVDQKTTPVFLVTPDESKVQEVVTIAQESGAVPIMPATALTMENKDTDGKLSVPAIIGSQWASDRADKLIPTVVTDERGVALGLVYSSQESLSESLKTSTGVYQSRKRGLWYKGASSGDVQELVRVSLDCDQDCLKFVVRQKGRGFCHLPQPTCFGELGGISKLEKTLQSRKISAPEGSYTARLFSDEKLLRAKIMEEAEELCDAKTKEDIAFEAADLIYFALTKAVAAGVTLEDIETSLDAKSVKVKRRQGDAKGQWAAKEGIAVKEVKKEEVKKEAAKDGPILMKRYDASQISEKELQDVLQRPSQKSNEMIMGIVNPIIKAVRTKGDAAVLEYTHKFEKATSLTSPVLRAPFPQSMMNLPQETIDAIDISFENIRKFHAAQKEDKPLEVETMPGIICSRFVRPIERVGLYVPGGTAVLPSTALMLGVPAMVAGCKRIVMATPPRADGSITPEVIYAAHKVGAECIVLAGGAQAVAAMAYGTESVPKVDKILGPGNQFVTAAKMHVSNDTNAGVSIDMPAGPSEVLVVADKSSNPAFVASDLLSQAEHGVDSQVILIAIDLSETELKAIEDALHEQAVALPRVDIVRGAISHSVTLVVGSLEEAMRLSNDYAPEHLILQIKDAAAAVDLVENAGSVFVGEWTPESVGDYSAGVNHSLPTYGYAKQYSGVNLGSYVKHITSSNLTAQGLRNVGGAVMQLAKVEELEAHRRAIWSVLSHVFVCRLEAKYHHVSTPRQPCPAKPKFPSAHVHKAQAASISFSHLTPTQPTNYTLASLLVANMATQTTKQRLALSIIDFLNTSLKDGTLTADDAESIEVATNCISEAFNVTPSGASTESQSLLQVYSVYENLRSKTAAASAAAPAPSTTAPTDDEKKQAEQLKSRGNSAMATKDYASAIDLYTQALALVPGNPIFLSNRAAAFSASKDHESARADAEASVAADPKYTKAWSRLGLARFALGDAKGSMEAYEKGIEYEGNGGSEAMRRGFETAKKKTEQEALSGGDDDELPSARGAGGAGGAGGMPDLSSLAGMFGGGAGGAGGGGMPDLSSIMSNPMFASMAQNLMSNPDMMNNLMSNPQLRDMASRFGGGGGGEGGAGTPDLASLMQDPSIAEMARNMMGGAGRGAGGGAGN
ncbi:hypothetical protein V497_00378 [Pseudogymnoascus sp. VKM F-4516 (FW-969)]|nr:hypothetical protein V497_00378 [Pseudogymnoascus sp. VKM F-4516 (FW-969)]